MKFKTGTFKVCSLLKTFLNHRFSFCSLGDFDFIVRRTPVPDKQGKLHTVAFVEPVKFRDGPPRPNDVRYGLLPGDQLLRINGTSVGVLSRNDITTLMEVFFFFFSFRNLLWCLMAWY